MHRPSKSTTSIRSRFSQVTWLSGFALRVNSERQIERVEHEEAAPEWLTDAEHQFERLERLKAADDAGEHPDHARLRT